MADVHRGRIQAQGGGTEKSVAWSRDTPPTGSEMLHFCDQLEAQLTDREKQDRAQPLARLHRFMRASARIGGATAPITISWRKPGSKEIRIDIEIKTGRACVPD